MWQHLEDQKVLLKYRILFQALYFLLDEINKFDEILKTFSLVSLCEHKRYSQFMTRNIYWLYVSYHKNAQLET